MKKILTILVLASLAITSMSAKSAQVQLNTTIAEVSPDYNLYYSDVLVEDNDTIAVSSITEDGSTELFSIKASSNLNSKLPVVVTIAADVFRTTLNNGSENVATGVTPIPEVSTNTEYLPAGLQEDYLVYSFKLKWTGDATLPAGTYTSDVTINYTIE